MLTNLNQKFASLPTAGKLLLILTAALLPIGLGLVWVANQGIREANTVLSERAREEGRLAVRSVESLIARNALALRVAANGRMRNAPDDCLNVQRALSITPAISRNFELANLEGEPICRVGQLGSTRELPLVAAGDIAVQIAPERNAVIFRVGLIGGIATASLPRRELTQAAEAAASPNLRLLVLSDGKGVLPLIENNQSGLPPSARVIHGRWPIAEGDVEGRARVVLPMLETADRLILLLPLLMWIIAALMTWLLVTRVLIRPLRVLGRAVSRFQPGDPEFQLPDTVGPAWEVQELRDAFGRAVERVEASEKESAAALDGQRRLVREVHHRVKNNLQVVASLLNIHGRSADSVAARDAYASISRRVGALSIVHRNHFAEMEENRGIALRPLLSELAAELRAGAPEHVRALRIDLDLEAVNTTQDVAVSVAFLVTEIVEYAMLNCPDDSIDIQLRRTSDLTAELGVGSSVLVPEEAPRREKSQFERIISGLAKQLRSDVERKLGRYSVVLPVFPPR
jgi:two-component system, sensor histidine kinase PdtaS